MICARDECSNEFERGRGSDKKVYCSQSCSAKVSNKNRAKPKGSCLYCTKQLINSAIKFCNTSCQRSLERKLAIQSWLSTGDAIVSSNPNHYVRVYIIQEQQYKCAICSGPNVWNNIELRFILDHIDGNSENNHRDNLRLVCPNCDSQLDTYKSKNKGNGRHARKTRYANGQSY